MNKIVFQINIANDNGTKIFTALYQELFESYDFDVLHMGGNGVGYI